MFKHVLLAAFGLGMVVAGVAIAQSAFQTLPSPVNGATNASGTVTSTNVFQSVFADVPLVAGKQGRTWCLVQNVDSNTAYLFVGAIASATVTAAFAIGPNQYWECNRGGVTIQDQISITGVTGQRFIAFQR